MQAPWPPAHASTMQNLKMRPVAPAASRQEPASSCMPGAVGQQESREHWILMSSAVGRPGRQAAPVGMAAMQGRQ